MSAENIQARLREKSVVLRIPGMEDVIILRDVEYRRDNGAPLGMDIYYPPNSKSGARTPAVVLVTGYPDRGYQKVFGCKQKEMASSISWARLAAASGLAAVTYENADPAGDAEAVLRYVRENAAGLGIDKTRTGVWSCSGNVPTALSLLMGEGRKHLKCAVLLYGYMLDQEGSVIVAEASRQWGFVNPVVGKSVEDLPGDLPLLVARAGRDETPGLNETIDRFTAKALARNIPLRLVNLADAGHAFDISLDTPAVREVIKWILDFLKFHLAGKDDKKNRA